MRLTDEQRGLLLVRFLEEKGVHFYPGKLGWQKVSCYGISHVHGDRNPSASVNLTRGRYKCFGCELEGDAVDLFMLETGLDFTGALAKLGVTQGKTEVEPTWL